MYTNMYERNARRRTRRAAALGVLFRRKVRGAMHLLKWLYPGMRFKRWLFLFAVGVMLVSLGLAVIFNYKYLDNIEELIFRTVYLWTGNYNYMYTTMVGAGVVLLGVVTMLVAMRFIIRSVITVILPDNSDRLVDIIYEKRKLGKGPSVTVVGGGHGLSVLLRGIKEATTNVTAVVTVADDGGSSGRLREELGIIPPGDLRNCLVALADTEPLMEKLFQHRFGGSSELAGHSFGNLFIAAMTEVTGDVEKALRESSKVLAVKGQVLPASTAHVRLDAIMEDGTVVQGESRIPEVKKRIHRVQLPEEGQAGAVRAGCAEECGCGGTGTGKPLYQHHAEPAHRGHGGSALQEQGGEDLHLQCDDPAGRNGWLYSLYAREGHPGPCGAGCH